MRLEITRSQTSDSDCFQYNHRTYYTESDNIIFDYLEVLDNPNKDVREWVEDTLIWMTVIRNDMSLGYSDKICNKVSYSILFTNDRGIKHWTKC